MQALILESRDSFNSWIKKIDELLYEYGNKIL